MGLNVMTVRRVKWISDDQFNFGPPTFNHVEVKGVGDAAYLALQDKGPDGDDVPFAVPGDYDYNPVDIEVVAGMAKLKGAVIGQNDWPFTIPANYNYDGNKIEVVGGEAKLKGNPVSPYAWWHLNEVAGAVASDSSGNGRDGALQNMEDADWVPGKLNNCLRFNEAPTTDEHIDCGAIASWNLADSFSCDFWIKVLGWPSGNIRVIWKYDGTRGYLIYVGTARIYVFFLDKNLPGYIQLHGSTPIDLDNWYHVAITYNGNSEASGVEIYVDGNLEVKTVVQDNIVGGNMVNATTLKLGGIGASYYLDGYLDEIALYEFVLTQAQVTERYNLGVGSESMPGSYPTDDPPIYPTAGYIFAVPLDNFTETSTKPANTGIRYHCSSDDGVTWNYWDGVNWVVTDDSYAQANTATEVNTQISSLAPNGTFKFRALLHTTDDMETPELDNIHIAEGVTYPIGSFEIAMNTDIQPAGVSEWKETMETVVLPPNTEIKYQYSIDSGANWNGSWLTEPQLETAIQGISCNKDGTDKIRFKFQLSTTDAAVTPEADNLEVIFEQGYFPSGSYKSFQYAPTNTWANGIYVSDITYDKELPTDTSVTMKARVVEHVLEDGFIEYENEDVIGICGVFIQFEAELVTIDIGHTPKVNSVKVDFHILIGEMRIIDEMTTSTKVTVDDNYTMHIKEIDEATKRAKDLLVQLKNYTLELKSFKKTMRKS